MQINLICGFLGSGKSTLVRRILSRPVVPGSLAVIVNEFGDVSIDGTVLGGHDVDIVELTSGCLCCTLRGSLVRAVEELRDRAGVERTVIEATGVAQPDEMREAFADPALAASVTLGPMVTVVDAARFAIFRQTLGEFYAAQVASADVILLNKTDLASADQIAAVKREIAGLNPAARLFLTERCALDDLGPILGEGTATGAAVAAKGEHAHPEHAAFDSCVLEADFDAERASLERFFADLPASVVRAKGFLTVEGVAHLVQFAAGETEITPGGEGEKRRLVVIGTDLDRTGLGVRLRAVARPPRNRTVAGSRGGTKE